MCKKSKLMAPPRYYDAIFLSIFTILITLQPYFMHGEINLFETGLYLPGVQSILNGEIPYRDFFHLRGPLELYMPALLMKVFGVHISTLYSYFYFGNVLCLILCILIAKELFKTRYILYLMAPVLVGRTFPRVVFTFWGGMRYAFGLAVLWFMVKFFKENKIGWIFAAGIGTALAGFTSIEMGVCPFLGITTALVFSRILKVQNSSFIFKSFGVYLMGICLIAIPYGIYLGLHSALVPYIDSVWTIVTRMQKVIDPHLSSVYPGNFLEAFAAMVNPGHVSFKLMTPAYLYIFFAGYLFYCLKKKEVSNSTLALIAVGIYGIVLYVTGFRGILGAQFEMALQPEKILLFFLLEIFLLMAIEKKSKLKMSLSLKTQAPAWYHRDRWKIYLLIFLMVGLFGSSIGYSMARYNRRFIAFQFIRDKISGKDTAYLKPSAQEGMRVVDIERASGLIVPLGQADELEQVAAFVNKYVGENEEFMTYPQNGTYNFLFARRHFGKFPHSIFSWFNDDWHNEYLQEFKLSKPHYLILAKEMPPDWQSVYLAQEPNRQKFQSIMDIIDSDYTVELETPLSYIYKLKQ